MRIRVLVLLLLLCLSPLAFAQKFLTGSLEFRLELPAENMDSSRAWSQVAFSEDGKGVTAVGTRPYVPVCSWKLGSKSKPRVAPLESCPEPVSLSSHASWCAAVDQLGRVLLLDPRSGRLRSQIPDTGLILSGCAFSPDESQLLVFGHGASICELGAKVVWSTRMVTTAVGTFAPNGKSVFLATADGILEEREAAHGKITRRWDLGLKGAVLKRIECSPDGERLALLTDDSKKLLAFDLPTGTRKLILRAGDLQWINDFAFSPDNLQFAVAGTRWAYILDSHSWGIRDELQSSSFVQTLCFSPDGHRIAVGTGSSVLVYKLTK